MRLVHSAPSVFLAKQRAGGNLVAVTLQRKFKRRVSSKFCGFWWLFGTLDILHMALGLLKKEEELKEDE